MEQGTVIWFNDAKGFGFIKREGGGADVFVHHKDIVAEGFRSLQVDERVTFDVVNEPRGPHARCVRVAYADLEPQGPAPRQPRRAGFRAFGEE